MSETVKLSIGAALCAAQKKIGAAAKDSKNPHFKSNYASLAAVYDACHEFLNEQGIAISQVYVQIDGETFLKTVLFKSNDESIESLCPLINEKGTMQGLGSATTYARRYSLAAICGVMQEDDDGEGAGNAPSFRKKPEQQSEEKPASRQHPESIITEPQRKRMYAIALDRKWADAQVRALIGQYGYVSSKDVLVIDYDPIVKELENGPDAFDIYS